MRIFRIGTLEYEMCRHRGDDIRFGGETLRSGENMLSVHTLQMRGWTGSNAMFPTGWRFPCFCILSSISVRFFHTITWLLSPALKLLLDEDSGILNFQKDYTIFSIDEDKPSFQGWVFKNIGAPPRRLSRKHVAAAELLKGYPERGKIGSGSGIIRKNAFME
jgi:hypothetical protein